MSLGIFKEITNSEKTCKNDYFITEGDILPLNFNKEKSNKIITKNLTIKEISKFNKEKNENKFPISERINTSKKIKRRIQEKSKKSLSTTILTNTMGLIDKMNNIKNKKFIIAQNKWKNDYFAIIIQKIFRGYFFRKNFEKYKKNKGIYQKKKVLRNIKNQKLITMKSDSIKYNNSYNKNKIPVIKTIFIKSFCKAKYVDNYPKYNINVKI